MSALLLLSRLKARAAFRSWWRAFKTPEGALRGTFTLLFLLVMLIPLFGFRLLSSRTFPDEYVVVCTFFIDSVFPLLAGVLLFMSLARPNSGNRLNFQPAEIDYLFTAPFSRRSLLIYKLMGTLTSTMLVCFALTCTLGAIYLYVEGSLVAGLVRCFLATTSAVLLAQLAFIWSGLVRKSIAIRLISPLRKFAAVGLVGLGVVSLFAIRDRINFDILQDPEQNVLPTVQAFFETRSYQTAIAPMKIFSNLILSDSIWEAFGWTGLCVAANGLMVWLIIKTDEDFIEQELHYCQLRAESLKKTATIESSFVSSESLQSLPMLPFMGGVGPIAWRQLQTFYRMKRSLIFQAIFYFAMIACFFFLESGEDAAQFRFALVISLLSAITFASALALPMGFHTDINRLEVFKSLPIARYRIALGQILGPVLALAVLQYATIAIFMFASLDDWRRWFAMAMFAPLVSTVLLSLVNSLALLYPKRPDDGIVRQLESIGHVLVFTFLMSVSGFVIVGSLATAGGLTYYFTQNTFLVLASCWIVMLLASVAGIWLMGWAFGRFDVSQHEL